MQFFLIVPGKYSGTSFIWTSACYQGTSIVRTVQIGHKSCSLLTMMKFGLDKAQEGSLKVAVYMFGGLFFC